jgi:hypothetical protein
MPSKYKDTEAMRTVPKFGDWFTNTVAGEGNPRRHAIFVRAGRTPHGRMNPGPWWEMTDGKGAFWRTNPSICVRISAESRHCSVCHGPLDPLDEGPECDPTGCPGRSEVEATHA